MYLQQYTEAGCAGDITVVSGVPTGVCLAEYDDTDKVIGSTSYNCDGGTYGRYLHLSYVYKTFPKFTAKRTHSRLVMAKYIYL